MSAPDQLLSHYRLVEKIGEGGMGVVWKAHDTVLDRPVAIKVLPPDVARDDARRKMFLDEARLASSVSDAHIVQIYELGRQGDLDFIAMEYIEGQPLSEIIRGRPLPPGKVANLAVQVARALSRAHRKGLLHRDLKPANILVTADGDVKVVDFGLATLLEHRDTSLTSSPETLTATGEHGGAQGGAPGGGHRGPVGTLPYMSPEQIIGDSVDARSDIYSLGVVLYEMTTGRRPFAGSTGEDLAREIRKARPRPPHEIIPKLPLELDRIIAKAMGASRTERYQTMDDLAVDLKRLGRDLESGSSPSYDDLKIDRAGSRLRTVGIWTLGATLLASILVALWWTGPWRRPTTDPHTVLILPMEVRVDFAGAPYAGRAFSEAVAMNLAQAKGVSVLAVPGDSDLAGPTTGPRAGRAARSGAGRLVTGAVTRDGHRVRVQLSLVDVPRDRILWGLEKVSEEGDFAELATQYAKEIASQMGAQIGRKYDYFRYVSGSPAMAQSPDLAAAIGFNRRHDFGRALELTTQLVERFPLELDAHVMRLVALVDAFGAHQTKADLDNIEKELVELNRLDPNNPYVPIQREEVTGLSKVLQRDDLTPALRAHALRTRAAALAESKHFDQAIADFESAVRLDPANPFNYYYFSDALTNEGRHAEALENARKAAAIDPIFNQVLAAALAKLGKVDESLTVLAQSCDRSKLQSECAAWARALQQSGRIDDAHRAAEQAESLEPDSAALYQLAGLWTLLGEKARAVRLLHRSVDLGYVPDSISDDKDFAALHDDHEFRDIVTEVKRRQQAK